MRLFSAVAVVAASLLCSCSSTTMVVRNTKATARTDEYKLVYLVAPKADPRKLMPQVAQEFRSMGFQVTVIDRDTPVGSQGTAFVISKDGYLLSCAHIFGALKTATVWLGDKRYEADVVASDATADLSLLKLRNVKDVGVTPVNLGSATQYKLGDEVYTIGYPMANVLGNHARLTKGLVSSTVGMKDDPNFVQISAEVQPGNSGGPLFSSGGTVVGVVAQTLNPWGTARVTGGALPQNVNFAIKSDVVWKFLKKNAYAGAADAPGATLNFEQMEHATARVRSGIMPAGDETKKKLLVGFEYVSIHDIWYRFRRFELVFLDYDSGQVLFAAGQPIDDIASSEATVYKDTFTKVRAALNVKSAGKPVTRHAG